MAQTVVLLGVNYSIPDTGDQPIWSTGLVPYLVAIASAVASSPAFMQPVAVASSPTTMISGKTYLVTTTSIAITLTLPAPATNMWMIIKDATGNAATHNITIARPGAQTIDGVASNKTLARPFGTWIICSDGTNYFVLNEFPDTGLINTDVATAAAVALTKIDLTVAAATALNMGSHLINSVTDPVSAQDAATKNYVDNIAVAGVTWKQPARLATTAALAANTYANGALGVGATLTGNVFGALSIDGVAVVVADRVLIKNEVAQSHNGVYVVTATGGGAAFYVLTRATDYDQASDMDAGDIIAIFAGNTLANTIWLQTSIVATVGSDNVTFSQFGATFPLTVANGGTGLQTLTSGSYIKGAGTSNVTFQAVPIPIADGGTNSIAALSNGRVMMSAAGAISEAAAALTSGKIVVANGSGVPVTGVTGDMSSAKITGLANGTVATDAAAFGQIKFFQAVQATTVTSTSTTSSTFQAATNLTVSITPTSASNRVRITVSAAYLLGTASSYISLTIKRGSTELSGVANGFLQIRGAANETSASFSYIDSPATTSSTTYAVFFRSTDNTGNVTIGSGTALSTIIAEEIA